MAIECGAILKLATDGIATADCEAKFRNIVGRAYYASFHRATAFHDGLPDQGLFPAGRVGRHRTLSYALEHPVVSSRDMQKKSRQVGFLCRDLHGKRIDADYNIGLDIKKKMAQQAVEQAQDIFDLTS